MSDNYQCKGCWEIGNNCGVCDRCAETALAYARRARLLVAAAREMARSLSDILEGVYENKPCQLDHNGFCQEHAGHSPCLIAEATEALAKWDEVSG